MKVVLEDGSTIDLGQTETSPTIGIMDFSRRDTDDFGVTTVVERGFSRRLSARLLVASDGVDALQRQLAGLRATAATWIADDRFAWLSPKGFVKDFALDLATPSISYCTLSVEGVAETEVGTDDGSDPAVTGTTSTLSVLRPVEVTDAVLVATNIPVDEAAIWLATATYASGARVRTATGHRIYESLIAGNIGYNPEASAGKWLDVGPLNRWAMFDQALGTATTRAGVISVQLSAAAADTVALLDLVGTSVRVQAAGYDRTLAITGSTLIFGGLPASTVTVTILGTGTNSVGTLLIGSVAALGVTEASPMAAITDFSRKEVDDFGEVTIVQRAWAKTMTAKALIRTDAIDLVADRVAGVRATPSLWIGATGSDALTVYGFFKEFSIEVGETVSKLSLSIEGFSAALKLGPLVNWPDVGDPDGTKPDDGATVGAPGGTPIGGTVQPDGSVVGARTAEQVVEELGVNTIEILAQSLRQDDFLQVVDARTLIEGQPVGAQFVEFRNEQTTATTAIESKLELLGAKTADGTAWNLDLDSVKVAPDKTIGQRFSEIGAAADGAVATVQDLQEVLVDGDGVAVAKAILALDVNGKVVGTIATNDGVLGVLDLLFDAVIIRNPATGLPIFTADTDTGIVKATRLEVDHLKVNTAIIPARASASSPVTSPDVFSTILSATISLPSAGWVEASATVRQSFSDGDHGWGYQLIIDGENVFEVSGGRTQDGIPLSGAKLCSPGDRTVLVRFNANPTVTAIDRSVFVKGLPATE